MDSIFLIDTGREAKLKNFLIELKMMHNSIKFNNEKSTQSIAFLTTLVYTNNNHYKQHYTLSPQILIIKISITNLLTPKFSMIAFSTRKHKD